MSTGSNAPIDQSSRQGLYALSSANDNSRVPLWANPVTHALLTESTTGSGTVTEVDTGTGLTGGPITTTGTVSLDSKLAPIDTLGSPGQSIRVNAGQTALEYYTPSAGSGTVTTVSVATANGFAGTVANATTTPAITISTSINAPVLAGNGTAIAAATTTGTGSTVVLQGSPTITTAALGSSTATTQSPSDNSTKLATTAYVDAAVLGQNFKEATVVATTANLIGVYLSNVFTYTATGTNTIDGVTLALGNRVLVKNQTTTFQNGWYVVTTAGTIGVAGVLTRSTDANTSAEFKSGDSSFVTSGTANSNTTWAYTGVDSPTLGTDAITYAQTAGQGSFTQGAGITITGNSIAITAPVTVALGGTNATSASITAFNNITGYTAAGATGTTSTNLVFSTSPSLVTPTLGVATVTSVNGNSVPSASDTIALLAATQTFTNKRISRRTTSVTQSATPTINSDNMDVAAITGLAQAITSMTTNLSGTPVQNDFLEIQITDNGTARGITWGTSFSSGGLVTLPTTTVISTKLRVLLEWDATTKWTCVAVA